MDSFDELVKLTHEVKESYENFLSKNLNVTVDEAFMNYFKNPKQFLNFKRFHYRLATFI
jgi:hypothetical protein